MDKKLLFGVSESLGKMRVTVTTAGSNMAWSMGLHFSTIEKAEEFRSLVEKFCEENPEAVSF